MSKQSEMVYVATLKPEDVMGMCIRNRFYTRGDNKAYDAMLSMCGKGIEPDDVLNIAQDIVDHTPEDHELLRAYESLDEMVCYLQDLIKVEIMCYCVTPDKDVPVERKGRCVIAR